MNDFDDPFQDWDAAYVLGSLNAEERREYENHIAHCAFCSRAVALFAGIPGILSKVDTQTALTLLGGAPQESTPPSWNESSFMQKLAHRAEQDRSHSRLLRSIGVAVASVILISIGVTTGVVLHHPSTGAQNSTSGALGRVINVANLQPQIMTATFRITSRAWGTRFDWNCTYPNAVASNYLSPSYDLVVFDTSGRKSIIATWSASGAKATGLAATSALPETQIKSVEVTFTGSTNPLVRGEI